jgi:hypothetical protein
VAKSAIKRGVPSIGGASGNKWGCNNPKKNRNARISASMSGCFLGGTLAQDYWNLSHIS